MYTTHTRKATFDTVQDSCMNSWSYLHRCETAVGQGWAFWSCRAQNCLRLLYCWKHKCNDTESFVLLCITKTWVRKMVFQKCLKEEGRVRALTKGMYKFKIVLFCSVVANHRWFWIFCDFSDVFFKIFHTNNYILHILKNWIKGKVTAHLSELVYYRWGNLRQIYFSCQLYFCDACSSHEIKVDLGSVFHITNVRYIPLCVNDYLSLNRGSVNQRINALAVDSFVHFPHYRNFSAAKDCMPGSGIVSVLYHSDHWIQQL